ncbi:MAG: glycoside hydrolase family 16 protein [Henriciella sp.]
MKLLVAPFLQIIATLTITTCLVLSACGSLEIGSEIDESPEMTGADWQIVWQDDFEGDKLDRTKWAPEVSCWGGGNDERQCYTDRPENIYLQDGALHLKAQAEEYTGPVFPPEIKADLGSERTQTYTSGKVRTRELASWKYGRFSARMKLPEGQGTWPAFWMMSAENVYGTWPLSGEIDIMEAVNLETPCSECPGGIERRTSGALHFGNAIPDNTYLYLNRPGSDAIGPSNQWRTYSVEWAEGVFQWFVDDEIFMRIESDDWFTGSPKAKDRPYAPFDQPFYLMLNLAVGGNLAEQKNGGGFDPSAFPAELLIDWVKVEQCPSDATGRSCLTSTNWSGTPQGPWETQAR